LNTKKAIQNIVFVAMWLAIGGGMLTLLIAAIGKQKRDHCKDYLISIRSEHDNLFFDSQEVKKLLLNAAKGNVKGQRKSSLNLQQLERSLEANVWIKDAELYFDNKEVLHVVVTEREPVARVFTITGKSFYIDESGKRMPLSTRLSARLPVFTGFPEKVLGKRDSTLLAHVTNTALFILDRPFWMSQVAQIDINEEKEFEMVPVVGNHTVKLGDGEMIDRKFHRLYIFYKNVLSKTGFEKYRSIDVQYAGQVIGIKDNGGKRDTSQLRLNVEKLLKQAREAMDDSLIAARAIKEQKAIPADPVIATEIVSNEPPIKEQSKNFPNPAPLTGPVPMKPLLDSKLNEKSQARPIPPVEKIQPKAVMKKRAVNQNQ
jgi:cell division protein FtsQ